MEILVFVLVVFSILFFSLYLNISKKYNQSTKEFVKLYESYISLQEVNSYISSDPDSADIHKENFIKFLSDSRDWAFEYIEEVQKGLDSFIVEVEPELEYFNHYGAAVAGTILPHDKALQKIYKEFQKLKKLLPESDNDRR
jgi:hypothetical protein